MRSVSVTTRALAVRLAAKLRLIRSVLARCDERGAVVVGRQRLPLRHKSSLTGLRDLRFAPFHREQSVRDK